MAHAAVAAAAAAAKSERDGRIRLQIELGQLKRRTQLPDAAEEALPTLSVPTVGLITSPYSTRNGTPPHKSRFKGTIKPPRLNGASVGVFSTRTPHRPAPIGLSLARILTVNVEEGWILFEGLDLVHGTPVVDVKPYVHFSDTPVNHFAPPWVAREQVNDEPLAVSLVKFDVGAREELERVHAALLAKLGKNRAAAISLYSTTEGFCEFVEDNLSLDFRSTRERSDPKFTKYRVTLCDIVVWYRFDEGSTVVVTGAEALTESLAQPLNA
ncbi:hypothetical protein HDU82_002681 [Entophlyctis luteolus]|nr:hypothetical protein HDU82_002681 [Entophlyctis luteolus]